MIQDKLEVFCKETKQELASYSLAAKTDWLKVLQDNECSAKHIREMYLMWLHLIAEEMGKDPRFECANTMENFINLKCHNADIKDVYQMVCDCFTCNGLFKSGKIIYEDEANEKIIAKPQLGLRNINKSLYDRGELVGFPWIFSFHSWSLRDIAGKIKLLCEQYFKTQPQTKRPRGKKYELLAKLKDYLNSANAVVVLPKRLNPKTHKSWLDTHYSSSASRQYSDWLDVVNHPELVPLLKKHGISPDIYSCTNLVQLTNMFEELVDNLTTEAQQANQHSNMVSAVRCYIEHLLEINGVII